MSAGDSAHMLMLHGMWTSAGHNGTAGLERAVGSCWAGPAGKEAGADPPPAAHLLAVSLTCTAIDAYLAAIDNGAALLGCLLHETRVQARGSLHERGVCGGGHPLECASTVWHAKALGKLGQACLLQT